ncbi:hypothetical protein N7540_011446 [Penicillium herquei]|nr:hypothetical protein N7540_011446 [Penicillium herquei]
MPYPKLQSMRRRMEDPSHGPHSNTDTIIRVSKRRRETEPVIQQLSHLEAKKRRTQPREEPSPGDDFEDPNANFAVLMRGHLLSLDNALRRHWVCVCQNCSGLSVRLSLPQQGNVETSFEVFFGVRSLFATTLQEAKITVK